MMKKLLAVVIAIVALAAAIPATLAYNSYITHPYAQYWDSPVRASSYTSVWGAHQGFYNYHPPVGTYRYDVAYHWGSNVRWPVYGIDQQAPRVSPYRPYYGYPTYGWQNPHYYAMRY